MLKKQDFFTKDSIIKTHHTYEYKWISTIVRNIYNDFVEVYFVDAYLTNILMNNDTIECKIHKDNEVCFFMSEVYNIKIASRTVVLKIKPETIKIYKREVSRRDVCFIGSASEANCYNSKYVIVKDIGKEGIGFICSSKLKDDIQLTIYTENFEKIKIEAVIKQIRPLDNNYIYGCQIKNIDDISKLILNEQVKKMQTEDKQLQQKILFCCELGSGAVLENLFIDDYEEEFDDSIEIEENFEHS